MTYQNSHNIVNEINRSYPENKATMIIEMGMNPGLISCVFVKRALLFLANKQKNKSKELKLYIKNKMYNKIASYLGVEVIHCSEEDIVNGVDFDKNKFYSTWCCDALLDESSMKSEFAYGTHELEMPKKSKLLYDNIIQLNDLAKDVYCESYVPNQKIIGVNIPHGENVSLASFLKDGIDYSPTIHYVYKYCKPTYDSFKNLNKDQVGKTLNDEQSQIISKNNFKNMESCDTVGCLLITKNLGSVWCGSILDTPDRCCATTIQVMASVLAGVQYILKFPEEGILFPDQVDCDFIGDKAIPYLGKFFLDYVDYKPVSTQFKDLRRTKKEFDAQFK